MKAKIGKTYLTEIPHKGGELTFQYPAFRGYFGEVAEALEKEGLKKPTSSETASLVYDAFQNKEGKYELEIISILNNTWFWEFTGNLYLPKSNEEVNNGVLLNLKPRIENGKLIMNKNDLIKRLRGKDPDIKFVPFGYKTGEQTVPELMKNPYIVARYDGEGAQKIAEIASEYKKAPKLWSFDSVDKEEVRMSALFGCWGFGDRLDLGGDWYGGNLGHAFGVCTPEK